MGCRNLLKFVLFVHYGSPKSAQWLKSTYFEIQDGGRPPIFQYLHRSNSHKLQ